MTLNHRHRVSSRGFRRLNAVALAACVAGCLLSGAALAEPVIYGWLESIYLEPSGRRMRAKLDTGAKTASLHAVDIRTFDKDGDRWVRFTIPGLKDPKKSLHFKRRVVREIRVKDHDDASAPRYVVEMEFCLGGRFYEAEFSLADRSNFNYRVILGRSMLQGNILVDPARTFTANKACKKLSPRKPRR